MRLVIGAVAALDGDRALILVKIHGAGAFAARAADNSKRLPSLTRGRRVFPDALF